MTAITQEHILPLVGISTAFSLIFQSIIALIVIVSLKAASKERAALERDMFGLLRKIEGLTSTKREQLLAEYDLLVESLSKSIPGKISNETSKAISELEQKVVTRLTELNPATDSAKDQAKIEEILKTVRYLEESVNNATTDAVKNVMIRERSSLAIERANEALI